MYYIGVSTVETIGRDLGLPGYSRSNEAWLTFSTAKPLALQAASLRDANGVHPPHNLFGVPKTQDAYRTRSLGVSKRWAMEEVGDPIKVEDRWCHKMCHPLLIVVQVGSDSLQRE